MLSMNPDYLETPPRKMGDGYAVLNSNLVHIRYSWDEPGMYKGCFSSAFSVNIFSPHVFLVFLICQISLCEPEVSVK